ncbi:hypothetical protein [Streptomyces buecherae]|uniref:hypothetical protein n=1 Tax=Streptomyces buecherae TaxID=2763006 RepID=UPI0036610CCE
MALLDILGCSMDELIELVAAPSVRRRSAAAGGHGAAPTGEQRLGDFRPKRARIVPE